MDDCHNIKIGQRYRFDYEFAGSNVLADYNSRHGQTCLVLRPLTDDECDPECQPMFKVCFSDGFEGHVWADELADIRTAE